MFDVSELLCDEHFCKIMNYSKDDPLDSQVGKS